MSSFVAFTEIIVAFSCKIIAKNKILITPFKWMEFNKNLITSKSYHNGSPPRNSLNSLQKYSHSIISKIFFNSKLKNISMKYVKILLDMFPNWSSIFIFYYYS